MKHWPLTQRRHLEKRLFCGAAAAGGGERRRARLWRLKEKYHGLCV